MERDLLIGTRFLGTVVLLVFAVLLAYYRRDSAKSKVFNRTRWLLVAGSLLLSLHTAVLFFADFPGHTHILVWVIDLATFLPAATLFIYGEFNLLRAGHDLKTLRIVLISFVVICYVLLAVGYATNTLINVQNHSLSVSSLIAALLSGMCLVLSGRLHQEMRRVSARLTDAELQSRNSMLKYTARSMSYVQVCIVIAPWVSAIDSVIVHSVFGLITVLVLSWYVVTFFMYGANMREVEALTETISVEQQRLQEERQRNASEVAKADALARLADHERERVALAVAKWEEDCQWLDPNMCAELALSQMGISARALNTYLKRERQLDGYRQWISQLRITRAQNLMLQHPEYSTESIGEMCGYMDRSNFSRAFKSQVGVSPRLWVQVQKMAT